LAGIFFVIGIVLGLIYAWQIDALEIINTTPDMLRQDLREDYLRMVVDSFSVNQVDALAIQRYESLGEYAEETSAWRIILPVGGVIVLVGVVVSWLLARRAQMIQGDEPYVPQPAQVLRGIPEAKVDTGETVPLRDPLATFRTTYNLGDDSYDDSFSIESATGDFLGECGVGIADVIGVDGPRKISALEVWLFDKNDIQTVTKVVMSQHSFDDSEARTRLAAKGDPTLVESGGVVELQTASLEVEARVVDFVYGEGVLPPRSFFERVTLELRAYQRD
jgi:hypothetical protein